MANAKRTFFNIIIIIVIIIMYFFSVLAVVKCALALSGQAGDICLDPEK